MARSKSRRLRLSDFDVRLSDFLKEYGLVGLGERLELTEKESNCACSFPFRTAEAIRKKVNALVSNRSSARGNQWSSELPRLTGDLKNTTLGNESLSAEILSVIAQGVSKNIRCKYAREGCFGKASVRKVTDKDGTTWLEFRCDGNNALSKQHTWRVGPNDGLAI